jgi:hypothetical protein
MEDPGSIFDIVFSHFHSVQTDSGTHPGGGGLLSPEQSDRGVEVTTPVQLVSRSSKMEL